MALILGSLLILLHTITAAPVSESFTMELIHRYSDRSPYYDPNLTESQIMERLMQQSRSYTRGLDSSGNFANTTGLIPRISQDDLVYLVKVGIGTTRNIFTRGQTYYLHFDTGSSSTWTQCKPCDPCFEQLNPTFDPRKSPTYKPIPHNHPLCPQSSPSFGNDTNCHFEVEYEDGTSVNGVLSKDTFTFKSEGGRGKTAVPDLVFGCSHSTIMQTGVGSHDGSLGMGRNELSIVKQMHSLNGGRFSYCLIKQLTGPSGFLRFGNEPLRGPVQRTPFEGLSGLYFLTLIDITIANRRLNLPPGTFKRRSRSEGGCVIDTGATFTHLIRPAYDRVTNELFRYCEHNHVERTRGVGAMEICFRTPNNYQILPQMILHFQNADYHIGWENLFFFHVQEGSVCFAVIPRNEDTVLGGYQQHNVRFEYNLVTNMLSFVPEDCSRDAGHG